MIILYKSHNKLIGMNYQLIKSYYITLQIPIYMNERTMYRSALSFIFYWRENHVHIILMNSNWVVFLRNHTCGLYLWCLCRVVLDVSKLLTFDWKAALLVLCVSYTFCWRVLPPQCLCFSLAPMWCWFLLLTDYDWFCILLTFDLLFFVFIPYFSESSPLWS